MTLVLLGENRTARVVKRVPEGVARSENYLRDLLFNQPEILPIEDIDPAIGPLVPVARELNVPGVGRIDAFFADGRGHLVIVECKLWRNPQARREVVGQILDYARALAGFSYDDLQREVSRSIHGEGNALYALVAEQEGALGESRFVDQVSRNLAAGRFLLIVAGDGITEGTRRIGEYLIAQPGLAFSFAMVEMAQYQWTDDGGVECIAIQPRLLAQTAVIERLVIRNDAQVIIEELREETAQAPSSEVRGSRLDPVLKERWRAFAERLIAAMTFDDPAQSPPRIGGFGWLKAPLPNGHWLTIWRTSTNGRVGVYANLAGTLGLAAYNELVADRTAIDGEFADSELPAPAWERNEKGANIAFSCSSPLPWDDETETEQTVVLVKGANQMVNSLRPRLEWIGQR